MRISPEEILAAYFVIAFSAAGVLLYYKYGRKRGVKYARPDVEVTAAREAPNSVAPDLAPPEFRGAPEESLEMLRLQVWRSRRRRVRLMGRIYLVGGLISLVAGYFTGYFAFEIVTAVMIPLGVFFTVSGVEPYVKSSLASQSVISTMRVLREALKANSDEGHAVFLPRDKEHQSVRMFIPSADALDGPVPHAETKGHFYTPLGHDLFQAYLREAGGRAEKNLPQLLDQLRSITTSGLELVDDLRFEVKGQEIDIQIRNATFAEIGRYPDVVEDVFRKSGCPVTNSMAEWISYGTGSKVKWLDAEVDPVKRTAQLKLSLIPASQN